MVDVADGLLELRLHDLAQHHRLPLRAERTVPLSLDAAEQAADIAAAPFAAIGVWSFVCSEEQATQAVDEAVTFITELDESRFASRSAEADYWAEKLLGPGYTLDLDDFRKR